jgi:tRNA A-37 threonylcarbamoyl transferase component Bud32
MRLCLVCRLVYRIGRELGSGAIGRVVEVHGDDGRVRAGKILHDSQRADERAQRRFEAEARLLTGIAHPNLIGVEGLVHIDGQAVLVMELVAGSDLAQLIAAESPLPAERVVALGRGVAAGLAEAHRAGLVHRDLKPANILLAADGTPKVADFGLARAASFAASGPDAAAVAGTPDYMAPESIDPLAIDGRSDLYALGCILCELVTGAPPYRGATALAILAAHREAPLPALDGVPDELRRTIRWLLAKSPADRPQSAGEAETALANLGAAIGAPVALALQGGTDIAASRRRCAQCGALGPPMVRVCFACGRPQLELASGPMTVFITGPGEHAHKLDAHLRQRLLDWISANPALGVDARVLAKEVPRVPFALVCGIDEDAAKALVAPMRELGLETCVLRGGRFAHREVRSKGWTLARRIAVIGMTGTFYAFRQSIAGALGGGAFVAIMALWSGFRQAGRPVVKRVESRSRAALPSALDAALGRVAGVVPAMSAARHRDALRGVVERALALRDALDPAGRSALDDQLADLIDVAALASSRLDQLESELSPDDLRSGDETQRARWHVRDRWAAKILQVTAFLDAMRARAVMSRARGTRRDELDDLRLQIAALQELS